MGALRGYVNKTVPFAQVDHTDILCRQAGLAQNGANDVAGREAVFEAQVQIKSREIGGRGAAGLRFGRWQRAGFLWRRRVLDRSDGFDRSDRPRFSLDWSHRQWNFGCGRCRMLASGRKWITPLTKGRVTPAIIVAQAFVARRAVVIPPLRGFGAAE